MRMCQPYFVEIVQTCQTAFRHGLSSLWLYPWLPLCSCPVQLLQLLLTTLPTSCDLHRIPCPVWPPRHFQSVNAIVSSAHCVLLGIIPACRRFESRQVLSRVSSWVPEKGLLGPGSMAAVAQDTVWRKGEKERAPEQTLGFNQEEGQGLART